MTFLASSVLLTSCKKDEEEPTITLTGGAAQTFDLGEATDPGATVADNETDGITATSDFATVVKKDEVNTYTVTYKAEDEAGNAATATKTVKVKSDKLAGLYDCDDIVTGSTESSFPNGSYTWQTTITQSTTEYNKILISNFGGFEFSVYATVTGNSITIPNQTVTQPGSGGAIVTLSGSGQYVGATKKITTFTYVTNGFGNGSVTLTKN